VKSVRKGVNIMASVDQGVATTPVAGPVTASDVEERGPVGSGSKTDGIMRVIAYIVLIFVALLMFVPFAYAVATSFKLPPEALTISFGNMFWPENPATRAYEVAREANVARWFFNSVLVALIWIIGRVITCTMAGYAFARMRFPGRDIAFLMILSTLMIPGIVTIIPKFILLDNLNLLNSYGALTLPFLTDAFGIFLMKQFFESFPTEIEEAARVDGANRFRIFSQIVVPNAIPAISALTIFTFQGSWNAFLEPVIFISGSEPDLFTLPVGLANFQQAYYTDQPTLMAISVITTLPVAIFFLIFQRYFIQGQTSAAVKG
jgi:multiple sugar transport system permease protein